MILSGKPFGAIVAAERSEEPEVLDHFRPLSTTSL